MVVGEPLEVRFLGGHDINNVSMRVKVRLNLLAPLRIGSSLNTAQGRKWIFFRYENIFWFHKGNGEVGHPLSRCSRLPL